MVVHSCAVQLMPFIDIHIHSTVSLQMHVCVLVFMCVRVVDTGCVFVCAILGNLTWCGVIIFNNCGFTCLMCCVVVLMCCA